MCIATVRGARTCRRSASTAGFVTQSYRTAASTGGANPRNAADTFPKQSDAFARFCSGKLSAPGQLRLRRTGRGYTVSTDAQFRAKYGKGTPAKFDLGEVDWDQSGARQAAEGTAEGLSLNRVEDGTWDPKHPDTMYVLTTEGGDTTRVEPGISRDGGGLWKLTFYDIEHPRLGGTIELLLDGSEAPFLNKPDNMDIDAKGNLLLQEDPGANAHVARIVAYNTKTGARGVLARFDPDKFAAGSPNLITTDEESSGIIAAKDVIGPGWFVFDAHVHKASPNPESVALGQLLVMKVDDFDDVYDID